MVQPTINTRQAGEVGEDGEVINHWNLDVQGAGLDVRQYFFSIRVVLYRLP